jgi:hypothetical protein
MRTLNTQVRYALYFKEFHVTETELSSSGAFPVSSEHLIKPSHDVT